MHSHVPGEVMELEIVSLFDVVAELVDRRAPVLSYHSKV
tara:strand:+ start:718 stop:834 length:117 start_codon:yes stop_codon:yes gene_type:complete